MLKKYEINFKNIHKNTIFSAIKNLFEKTMFDAHFYSLALNITQVKYQT